MKNSILNLKNVQVLTKEERKNVQGGGFCDPGSSLYHFFNELGLCQIQ